MLQFKIHSAALRESYLDRIAIAYLSTMIHRDALWILKLRKEKVSKMTMKKSKTRASIAAVAVVLLTLCLVFAAPVSAEVFENCQYGKSCTEHEAAIGNTHYTTLEEAIDVGGEIKVLKNTDLGEVILEKSVSISADTQVTITVDGDDNPNVGEDIFTVPSGYTLTLGKNITLTSEEDAFVWGNGGNIIINGAVLSYSGTAVNPVLVEGGFLTVNDGSITCTSRGTAIKAKNSGTIIINGGIISGAGANSVTIDVQDGSAATISGGKITSAASSAIAVIGADSTATISGGEVTSANNYAAYASDGGKITVTGNGVVTTKTGSAALIAAKVGGTTGGLVEVTGGTINGGVLAHEDASAEATISGGTINGPVGVKNGASMTVNGGTFTDLKALNYLGDNADVTVNLAGDVSISSPITIDKKATVSIVGTGDEKSVITYDGTNSASGVYAAVEITGAFSTVTLTNLDIKATDGSAERGVNVGAADVTLNINGCAITGKYAINVRGVGDRANINVANSELDASVVEGYSVLNNWGTGCTFTFEDCTLIGKNTYGGTTDGWNSFGVIVLNRVHETTGAPTATVTLTDCTIEATMSEGSDNQYVFDVRNSGNSIIVKGSETVVTYPNADLLGRFLNGAEPTGIMSVEAGTFRFEVPKDYIADGYACVKNADGKYTVVAKTYDFKATDKIGFDSVKVGYTQPAAQTVTITNGCNVPVELNQPTSTNYVIGDLSKTVLAAGEEATFTIQPKAGLAVGNYADTITLTTNETSATANVAVSFLVYQPSSGGSSKPVEEPEEPVVEPEVPTEEPVAGEATVETEVTDGGEVELETPTAGGSAAADEDETKITGVVLPTGTDSEVTFVPVSEQAAPAGKETQTKKVFEINVPTYEKGKAAVIKFTMTVAELTADGKTAADVALWHFDEETGEWTKLVTSYTIVDGVVYFEAITEDFSPFAIVYEDTPAEEPTEEPTEEPATPAPILAVLAGLGAAVVLRRK